MTDHSGPAPRNVPRPDAAPGSEPADPWTQDEAAQDDGRWVSESGGLGPLPARTWRRGQTRVTVGGCCLPLPIGCLATVAAATVVAASALRRAKA